MQTIARRARRLLPAVLLALAPLSGGAFAQAIITTTIPADPLENPQTKVFDTNKPVILTFRTASLPASLPARAKVSDATLRLVASKMLKSADVEIAVDVVASGSKTCSAKDRKEGFDSLELGGTDPGKNKAWLWRAAKPNKWMGEVKGGGQTTITLCIRPGRAYPSTRQWYSPSADDTRDRPRLILDYTVPGRPEPVQALGLTAARSPTRFLPEVSPDGAAEALEVYVRLFASGDVWSSAPAFGNGLVYLVAGTGKDHKEQLEARSSFSGGLVWSIGVPDAGQQLRLAPSGRLYVVGKDKLYVYQIDPANPRAAPRPRINLDGTPQPVVSFAKETLKPGRFREVKDDGSVEYVDEKTLGPGLAPAVGPDGGLYYVNEGRIAARNPDLEPLWSAALGDVRVGPITVGPSGRFIYLVSATHGLLVFDAQTGRNDTALLGNQDALKRADEPALFAPAVLRSTDGTEYVFVAANSASDGALTLFKNGNTRAQDPSPGLEKLETLEKVGELLDGLWSQPLPVLAADGPYVVALRAVKSSPSNNKSYTITELSLPTGVAQGPTVRRYWQVFEQDPSVWAAAGRPVVDSAGNLMVWHPHKLNALGVFTDSDVRGARRLEGFPGATFLLDQTADLTSASRLLFGSDGALYAEANDRRLFVVLPQVTLDTRIAKVEVRSPTGLRVTRSYVEGSISASGGVEFGPGTRLLPDTRVAVGVEQKN